MRRFRKIGCLVLVGLLFSASIVTYAKGNKVNEEKYSGIISADAYEQYLQNMSKSLQEEGGVVWEIDSVIDSNDMQTTISVPEDGSYVFGISYCGAEHKKSTIEIRVKIDGQYLSEEAQALQLDKIYRDVNGVRKDGIGNEFAAEQGAFEQSVLVYPINEKTYQTYQVELEKGEHQISLASLNDKLYISEVVLMPQKEIKECEENIDEALCYQGKAIIREGEDSLWKNSSWLVAQADNASWEVTPSNPVISKMNYIGGSNWKQSGETITWDIEVPEDGYYQLGFSYRQSLVVNYSSYRRLLIDGICPFKEAEGIEFPYGYSWNKLTVSDEEDTPCLFYLTRGVHIISLQVTLGEYHEICQRLQNVIGELGDINLKMTMITGETVDISRDYDLFKYIPNLQQRLETCVKEMKELEEQITEIADGESGTYALVLRNMVQVVNQMLNNKYSAARYKGDFYTNYSSLSVCLNDMQTMPLDIDQIILGSPEEEKAFEMEGGLSGFFKQTSFSIRRFWESFFKDYKGVSGDTGAGNEKEKLTLWVNWGQDQARVLNSMIQTDFSTEYGIDVEVQVVNASVVQAILSGNGPDLVLQQARTEPVNLAMRGALYDLTNFEDYEEVLENFAEGAATPYYYKDGLYALPDTQTYNVMFYRKDILDELGIEVPSTWDEFSEAAEILLHNNLSVWIPHTQIASSGIVNTGVGGLSFYPTLLLQNEVPLYSEDGKSTNLTSPEALNVFQEWMDYYTKMKFPATLDFYNRFRAGTCPLGIAPYSTAVTLTTQAPELSGLWGMTIVPGTVNEDGSINHTTAGGGTGCSILNISDHKKEAWEFLKWWTSEETQTAYSTNLESILGPLGRVMVSNTEALKNLSWTDEELEAVLEARENLQELPEYPGGYQVSRSIDMAFYDVINHNVNAKDILTEWGKVANNEIKRKWEQYETKGTGN